jgi:hypothetical protein
MAHPLMTFSTEPFKLVSVAAPSVFPLKYQHPLLSQVLAALALLAFPSCLLQQ